jgi:hypothetical protein
MDCAASLPCDKASTASVARAGAVCEPEAAGGVAPSGARAVCQGGGGRRVPRTRRCAGDRPRDRLTVWTPTHQTQALQPSGSCVASAVVRHRGNGCSSRGCWTPAHRPVCVLTMDVCSAQCIAMAADVGVCTWRRRTSCQLRLVWLSRRGEQAAGCCRLQGEPGSVQAAFVGEHLLGWLRRWLGGPNPWGAALGSTVKRLVCG